IVMKKKDWLALSVLLTLTLAIYSRIWGAPPLSWDDGSNIFANPTFTMHVWWWPWKEPYYGLYVPVTSSVWAFLLWVGGGATWPFRALNLCLHLANVSFVYILL